jgi:hypothetical protein
MVEKTEKLNYLIKILLTDVNEYHYSPEIHLVNVWTGKKQNIYNACRLEIMNVDNSNIQTLGIKYYRNEIA